MRRLNTHEPASRPHRGHHARRHCDGHRSRVVALLRSEGAPSADHPVTSRGKQGSSRSHGRTGQGSAAAEIALRRKAAAQRPDTLARTAPESGGRTTDTKVCFVPAVNAGKLDHNSSVGGFMRAFPWAALAVLAVPVASRAVETCASASAKYVAAVVLAARNCLVRQLPQGRSCVTNNRIPNLRAQRVQAFCPTGTLASLTCTARQALLSTGLPYASLAGSGFGHVCTGASCGNGVLEPGEQCDDGNVIGGDNCSPTCQIEGGACNGVCAGVDPVSGTEIGAERIAR